ncbi:DUF862-domain-containing protein [Aulographum hederae CBS 113979]|uniref:DUF862-domain-containing protein n=1 Tax=Aulographum hederae CBS 113979 TaxID=1176131 RepID=A0A6G1GV84_9PEZI|nr:DUF862-domain-containing protein [Aulographum hederae CBS 113979]
MRSSSRPKLGRKSSSNHRNTLSLQKTEIRIDVYDLLPPGKLSSFLWFLGGSLLHSGVVIAGKEYAFGGHEERGKSGVYWTKPKTEPPGGTFRCEILHGFSFLTDKEIHAVIQEASHRFQGTSYNLLTNNCNHFTSYLCSRLSGSEAPSWLNRAASIGVALPCVVPREWLSPPDYETADGELLDEDEEDERAALVRREDRRRAGRRVSDEEQANWDSEMDRISERSSSIGKENRERWKAAARPKDTSGRNLPPAERAPAPRAF